MKTVPAQILFKEELIYNQEQKLKKDKVINKQAILMVINSQEACIIHIIKLIYIKSYSSRFRIVLSLG